MKMILLPKQIVTNIVSALFYGIALNAYSVSNRVKTWIDLKLRIGCK